ncbi:MAG TPA: ABC transporter permease [Ktedonobacterales bacterium]|jgi:osmoprotectant transport system permease protein
MFLDAALPPALATSANFLGQVWAFIQDPANAYGEHLWTTILLSVFPIVLAFVIALPLGILTARRPVAAFLSTNLSGVARAIPSIALLALMLLIPGIPIGFVPSVIALTLLGIPPILLNTIAGMQSIDPAAIDAARGMGMTRLQILQRVEAPLALPVIAAGVRIAAVQIVATTPIAYLIGASGFGEYIVGGMYLADYARATAGALGIVLLALLTEALFGLLQRVLTPAGIRAGEKESEKLAA